MRVEPFILNVGEAVRRCAECAHYALHREIGVMS